MNQAQAPWWEAYAANETSQSGEDGILRRMLEIVPPVSRTCVEFGAWDGRRHSNTYRLATQEKFGGVMIEADPERHRELCQTFAGRDDVACVRRFVEFEGPNSLDRILEEHGTPREFDVLSIDIDGNDYHIWDSVRAFRPRIVVIEFNPTIPNHVEFVQPRDMRVNQGSSLLSIARLGRSKGYRLVAVTRLNGIFVPDELFPLFNLADDSVAALRPNPPHQAFLFQLYDGTLVVEGQRRLLWEKVEIGPRQLQVLPAWFRFNGKGSGLRWVLKRLYLRLLWWRAGKKPAPHAD